MHKTTPQIEEKVRNLPSSPGIYIWKDKLGSVIYVGKAKNLKNRIKSYLNSIPIDIKTEQLVKNIADLSYILTTNENEAFLLESNLIKEYKPRYNILLKDDKRYPFVKITLYESFPRITITRELVKDSSKYYGPYTDLKSLRRTLRLLEWVFPIRNCSRTIEIGKTRYSRPCINYQLGKCPAPCVGYISRDDYMKIVYHLIDFFQGKHQEILDDLKNEMINLSDEMRFEAAAKIRDRIIAIENIQKRQAVHFPDQRNVDIIGYYQDDAYSVAIILKMINGKIINQENYPLQNSENVLPNEALNAFIKLYYTNKDELPDEILLPDIPLDYEELNTWLKNRLVLPQRGDKAKLIAIAKRNAFNLVEEHKLAHLKRANRTIFPIQELKDKLNLSKLPRKIVCMDISNIQGTDTVSSAVFYENGKPKKKFYRHFIIRSIETQNDFAAMSETLVRFLNEVKKDIEMKPDLIIIDGGKGQLNSAYQELQKSELNDIYMISLAKRIEEIFIYGSNEPLVLPKSSSALRLITSIRDEAHRFAVNFHRSRRSKRTLISELESIKGIGEQTKFILLKHFGSVNAISQATVLQLAEVKNIGTSTAQIIYDYFHNAHDKSTLS